MTKTKHEFLVCRLYSRQWRSGILAQHLTPAYDCLLFSLLVLGITTTITPLKETPNSGSDIRKQMKWQGTAILWFIAQGSRRKMRRTDMLMAGLLGTGLFTRPPSQGQMQISGAWNLARALLTWLGTWCGTVSAWRNDSFSVSFNVAI